MQFRQKFKKGLAVEFDGSASAGTYKMTAVQPEIGRAAYAGATSRPIAHRKAAISRAIAATTTGSFLRALLSWIARTQPDFQAMSRTAFGSPSIRALSVS